MIESLAKFGNYIYAFCIVGFIFLIHKVKIPIICASCDNPNLFVRTFFRCLNTTGPESQGCKFSKSLDETLKDMGKFVSSVTNSLTKEFSDILKDVNDIPQGIRDAILVLLKAVIDLKNELIERIGQVSKKFKEAALYVYNQAKDLVLKAYKEVYEKVINPIILYVTEYVIEPFKKMFEKVMNVRDKIIEEVKRVTKTVGSIITTIPDKIFMVIDKTIQILPTAVEKIIMGIISGLNTALSGVTRVLDKGMIDPLNKGIRGVTNAATTIINPVLRGYNKFRNVRISAPRIKIPVINKTIGGVNIFAVSSLGLPRAPSLGKIGDVIPSITVKNPIPRPNLGKAFEKMKKFSLTGTIKKEVFKPINNLISEGYEFVMESFDKLITQFTNIYSALVTEMVKTFYVVVDASQFIISEAVDGVKTLFKVTLENVMKSVNGIIKIMKSVFTSIKDLLIKLGDSVLGLLKNVVVKLVEFFKNLTEFIVKIAKFLGKNSFYLLIHGFSTIADKIIPIDVNKTTKLYTLLFLGIVMFLSPQIFILDNLIAIIGEFVSMGWSLVEAAYSGATGAAGIVQQPEF